MVLGFKDQRSALGLGYIRRGFELHECLLVLPVDTARSVATYLGYILYIQLNSPNGRNERRPPEKVPYYITYTAMSVNVDKISWLTIRRKKYQSRQRIILP